VTNVVSVLCIVHSLFPLSVLQDINVYSIIQIDNVLSQYLVFSFEFAYARYMKLVVLYTDLTYFKGSSMTSLTLMEYLCHK